MGAFLFCNRLDGCGCFGCVSRRDSQLPAGAKYPEYKPRVCARGVFRSTKVSMRDLFEIVAEAEARLTEKENSVAT